MISEFDKDILAGTEKKRIKRFFFNGTLRGMTIDQTVDKTQKLGLFRSVWPLNRNWHFDYIPKTPT